MNSKQYYETVDFVKEKPPSNGMYLARVKGYEFNRLWFSDGGWYYYGSNKLLFDIDSWLRPLDLSELIENAFNTGWVKGNNNHLLSGKQYLQSLIKTTNEQ